VAVATSHVEHRFEAGQLVGRERQDLLLVLGIRAAREVVDPPLGVLLPQITGGIAFVVAHDERGYGQGR
jgi:hypothetical protein